MQSGRVTTVIPVSVNRARRGAAVDSCINFIFKIGNS